MDTRKRKLPGLRVLAVMVTVTALIFLFRRFHAGEIFNALRSMQGGWYVAAVILFGLLFLPAAIRWRVALQLTDSAVNLPAIARYSLIGHFFYAILFGAAGGDTAKCLLYARRYRLENPNIFAAASLDRLMGFGGLLIFATLAFAIAGTHGGLRQLGSLSIHWPVVWIGTGGLILAFLILKFARSERESLWNRFAKTFLVSVRRLIRLPRSMALGLFSGLLVQVALSGTFALCLQAVSDDPLPWSRLIWTFPVISVVSALPISVAGLGIRDGAAVALLGLCGVPGADAIAASLLTASVNLLWAAVGGLMLWRQPVSEKSGPGEKANPALAMPEVESKSG